MLVVSPGEQYKDLLAITRILSQAFYSVKSPVEQFYCSEKKAKKDYIYNKFRLFQHFRKVVSFLQRFFSPNHVPR